MKKIAIAIILAVIYIGVTGQITDAEKQLRTLSSDSIIGWTRGGVINLNISQTSLTNWSAGGQSSFSFNGLLSLNARNKQEKTLWENYLDVGYGTLKQKETDWRKTDDRIDFTSKFGIKATEKLYYAGLLSFKTQMTPGYNYPNDSIKISGLFAPAYLLVAAGIDYVPNPDFTVFFAPLTYKLTLVGDDSLSADGAFGVEPGKKSRQEFGGYLRMLFKKDLMENISLQTKLELFTNYLEDAGAVDISWETLISMKVNNFISATLSTHLLYDQDIKFEEISEDGNEITTYYSKIQFKEVLAVGLLMNF
jgi:hypothetical protein